MFLLCNLLGLFNVIELSQGAALETLFQFSRYTVLSNTELKFCDSGRHWRPNFAWTISLTLDIYDFHTDPTQFRVARKPQVIVTTMDMPYELWPRAIWDHVQQKGIMEPRNPNRENGNTICF
jgi:hypothetical protein